MDLTVSLDEDGVTVTAGDVHPVNYEDACRHCGDLLLRLHKALSEADA